MKKLTNVIFLSLFLVIFTTKAFASCDFCPPYLSEKTQNLSEGELQLSFFQQYSSLSKLQLDGKHTENKYNQNIKSSHSHLLGTYYPTKKLGFDLKVPFLYKDYQKYESGSVQTGKESGLGDVLVQSRYTVFSSKKANRVANIQVFAGVKLPTGNSDLLKDEHGDAHTSESSALKINRHAGEVHETTDVDTHDESMPVDNHDVDHSIEDEDVISQSNGGHDHENHEGHDDVMNAIHGHDLALGSGSVDFPVGVSYFAQSSKFLFIGSTQYTFRTEGDHNYRYADLFTYRLGSSYYLEQNLNRSIALGFNITGEHKKNDKLNGVRDDATRFDALYAGPQVLVNLANEFTGDLSLDIPLHVSNSGLQATPEYRLRAGLNFFF